jgi:hypothetical protein
MERKRALYIDSSRTVSYNQRMANPETPPNGGLVHEPPDPTIRAIYDVLRTLGADTPYESSFDDVPGEVRAEESPTAETTSEVSLPTFDEILASLTPHGSEADWRDVRDIARNRLPELLARLPRMNALPKPGDIGKLYDQYGNRPILLSGGITVEDMRAHLQQADETTHEIGITTFGETYVLHLGEEPHGVTPPYWWQTVEDHATTAAHTHPTEITSENINNHNPSVEDLKVAQKRECACAVFSPAGLVVHPHGNAFDTLPTWREHAFTAFQWGREYSYKETVAIKDKYLEEVLGAKLIPWDELPPGLTLQQAIAYASELRAREMRPDGLS